MSKNFEFKHITLIFSRNCNLDCSYCNYDYKKSNMTKKVLENFFSHIIKYHGYNLNISLFGGEPLINREGFEYLYYLFVKNKKIFLQNNINIFFKIATNGTILNDDYISLFKKINNLQFVSLSFNISIDGNKETNLNQRIYRGFHFDYYKILLKNINLFKESGLKIELSFVMSIKNRDFFKNLVFLIKQFNLPIFIMPEEILWSRIIENNFAIDLKKYLIDIERTFKLLKKFNLTNYIINYQHFIDVRKHGVGPTVDVNGDLYETRHFVIIRDIKKYKPIGNILDTDLIKHFLNINLEKRALENRKIFYGRSESINLKIGKYFTEAIYNT